MVRSSYGSDFPERQHVINDPETGVRGIIAIHSTVLGPAAGGCRFWHYENDVDMVQDAVRLARGMSYKNAMADLPFGGGKAVLQRPKGDFDRATIFRIFAEAVEDLGGAYVTAEDVGTTIDDMKAIRRHTRYVAGLAPQPGKAGGDPSPWTALGVFESMKVAARFALDADLSDLTIAVQGTGNVGGGLCSLLAQAGAKLIIADVTPGRRDVLAATHGATIVDVSEIAGVQADVFAPCALGGALNERTIPMLKARVICGGANNQLATPADGEALLARGITYAPDYVVNAGGIINVAAEYLGETTDQVRERVHRIGSRLRTVLDQASREHLPVNVVADRLAQQIITEGAKVAA
ncbi:Glu/Leu/Phe/Val dehydrogenase (plasmid) [Sphingomonas paeninsulae]|uniref:Glu/Leu/Phe/Val dehydrogenase n=1 Tax=Sphingomonas paeninsulae TaxID=2319844 RepID=A0A494TCJ2_SPHPE|nr:Glu/Leu/Phe/Val dehydrogenase dimerization domain-containing protein [Sphingomonas paeninsulae]AYJ84974.1 Glu/Leu/Phe/Val dehydrogenase [Sphingomonas paeninsulae]